MNEKSIMNMKLPDSHVINRIATQFNIDTDMVSITGKQVRFIVTMLNPDDIQKIRKLNYPIWIRPYFDCNDELCILVTILMEELDERKNM